MRLWLCRHAPVLIESGICYGVSDVPFDEAASHAAAQTIAMAMPTACSVWASPAARTTHLAKQLLQCRPDLRLTVDPRLAEMHFGAWELKKWDDIPKIEIDAWVHGFAHYAPGGGESVQELMARVVDALHHLRSFQLPEALWLTHAGVIRAVQFWAAHGERHVLQAADWPHEPIPYGEATAVDIKLE
jgi:alpha-ribazole phosphatase